MILSDVFRHLSNHLLSSNSDLETREEEAIHSASVGAPNITMSVTDRNGNPIKTAQVGDSLTLRVEITDKNSKSNS